MEFEGMRPVPQTRAFTMHSVPSGSQTQDGGRAGIKILIYMTSVLLSSYGSGHFHMDNAVVFMKMEVSSCSPWRGGRMAAAKSLGQWTETGAGI